MKISGRKLNFSNIPVKIVELSKMFWNARQFENPMSLIRSYLNFSQPPGNAYTLKGGKKLLLSSNPHDSITVMVIFCRKEYGSIPANGIVVDVGANIGMFSMYAALNGAKKVYAFEPNKNSFAVLCENIRANGLEEVIVPFNLGVSDKDNKKIFLPDDSSPYNRASEKSTANNLLEVNTVSLTTIRQRLVGQPIDLCKIDCEGAEYEILYNTEKNIFDSITDIRLEHHDRKRKRELLNFFSSMNYHLVNEQNMILWLSRHHE